MYTKKALVGSAILALLVTGLFAPSVFAQGDGQTEESVNARFDRQMETLTNWHDRLHAVFEARGATEERLGKLDDLFQHRKDLMEQKHEEMLARIHARGENVAEHMRARSVVRGTLKSVDTGHSTVVVSHNDVDTTYDAAGAKVIVAGTENAQDSTLADLTVGSKVLVISKAGDGDTRDAMVIIQFQAHPDEPENGPEED